MGLLQRHRRSKIQGQEIGEVLGKAEGARENAIKVALKLMSKKTPIDEIADITDLTIEEIKDL